MQDFRLPFIVDGKEGVFAMPPYLIVTDLTLHMYIYTMISQIILLATCCFCCCYCFSLALTWQKRLKTKSPAAVLLSRTRNVPSS